MISTRGPDNIPVLERNVVPLKDICEAIVLKDTVSNIETRFSITKDELMYCANAFVDNYGPSSDDFIEIECNIVDGSLEVITAGVSDWLFINVVLLGMSVSEEDVVNMLFAHGLKTIMYESLTAVKDGESVEELGFTHNIVFESFQASHGKVDQSNVDFLLESLDVQEL